MDYTPFFHMVILLTQLHSQDITVIHMQKHYASLDDCQGAAVDVLAVLSATKKPNVGQVYGSCVVTIPHEAY